MNIFFDINCLSLNGTLEFNTIELLVLALAVVLYSSLNEAFITYGSM